MSNSDATAPFFNPPESGSIFFTLLQQMRNHLALNSLKVPPRGEFQKPREELEGRPEGAGDLKAARGSPLARGSLELISALRDEGRSMPSQEGDKSYSWL